MDLAYSAAVRVLGGANLLAPDVVQAVFTDAARKASILSRHATVAGWLHTSVRLTSYHTGTLGRSTLNMPTLRTDNLT